MKPRAQSINRLSLTDSYDGDLDQTKSSHGSNEYLDFVPCEPIASEHACHSGFAPQTSSSLHCPAETELSEKEKGNKSITALPAHLQFSEDAVAARPKRSLFKELKRKFTGGDSSSKTVKKSSSPLLCRDLWKSRIKTCSNQENRPISIYDYLARRWTFPAETIQSTESISRKMWLLCHMLRGNTPAVLPHLPRQHAYVLLHALKATAFAATLPSNIVPPPAFSRLVEVALSIPSQEGENANEIHCDSSAVQDLLSENKPERTFKLETSVSDNILRCFDYFEAERRTTEQFLLVEKLYRDLISEWDVYLTMKTDGCEMESFCETVQPLSLTAEFINSLQIPSDLLSFLASQFKDKPAVNLSTNVTTFFAFSLHLNAREKENIVRTFWLPRFFPSRICDQGSLIKSDGIWEWNRYDWDWTIRSCTRKPRTVEGLQKYLEEVRTKILKRDERRARAEQEIMNVRAPMPNPLRVDPVNSITQGLKDVNVDSNLNDFFACDELPPISKPSNPLLAATATFSQRSLFSTRPDGVSNGALLDQLKSGMNHVAPPIFPGASTNISTPSYSPSTSALRFTGQSQVQSDGSAANLITASRTPSRTTLYSTDEDALLQSSVSSEGMLDDLTEAADLFTRS